jgi:anthranilate phosphoribosyltransferase
LSIIPILKDIGRGAHGARHLDRVVAQATLGRILDGEVGDLEVGAFVMAMRMKGETLDELSGFLDAAHERCLRLRSDRPVVLIPSYNGSRRLPNLTPLLAMELARAGARVLVHGPAQEPQRVGTAQIFQDLGLPRALHQADVHAAWARREPAFMALDTLCQPLQRLLDIRWTVGLRNCGHSIVKMLHPLGAARCLRIVNTTHPEFGALMAQWAEREAANAMLLRGTEGEPVADPRRQPRIDTYVAGVLCPEACVPAQEGVLTELPLLPRDNDAATTALYIQAVLAGERPAPAPLTRQVQAVLHGLQALEHGQPMLNRRVR